MGSRRTKLDHTRAVAYIRCSTDRQDESPGVQRAAIAAYAAAHGVRLVAEHADVGVSGATEGVDRPGLAAALAALRTLGAGLLLVQRRDRLGRDVGVTIAIERALGALGSRAVAVDVGDVDGVAGMVLSGTLDLIAQVERRLISDRTKAALAAKRARGERVGQVPLGARAIGARLVSDPREARGLDAARRWRAEGVSWRRVVARLGVEHPRSRGRRWHLSAVARVLGGGR